MLRLCLLFVTLALVATSYSVLGQCSDWDKLLGYKHVSINDAARDQFGNLYVVGSFNDHDFTLGPFTFPRLPGNIGAFIAKFDRNHSLIWATAPVTGHFSEAVEVEVDAQQNILVSGNYTTSVSFDCITLSGEDRDIFVASYSADGTAVWATSSSGDDSALSTGLTISPNGMIIVTSYFSEKTMSTPHLTQPDIAMGGVPVKTSAVDQLNAGLDSFIAAIRTDGTVAWTKGIGGDGNHYEYVRDVTTDSEDNIIVTGYFSSPQISLDGNVLQNFGQESYFLAKIDKNGVTQWVKGLEGGNFQSGWGVEADDDNNIFVTGRFQDNADFDGLQLTGKGDTDVFIAKINPSGVPFNVMAIGGAGADGGTQIEVDHQGQVVVSGFFQTSAIEIGSFSSPQPNPGEIHSYLATLSNDLSEVKCVKFITGDTESILNHLELDPFDNVMASVVKQSPEGMMRFDGQNTVDPDYITVMAFYGNNLPVENGGTEKPMFPQVFLDMDTTLCSGEKVKLSAKDVCNAQYLWSTGNTSAAIEVTEPGNYWVDITRFGNTVRSKIKVSYYDPIAASLGEDQVVCPGSVVSWSLPHYPDAVYQWSGGGISNSKTVTVNTSVEHWVQISNRCETIRATVTLGIKPQPDIDLGKDIEACNGDNITLSYVPSNGETLLWSDGSTGPSISVNQTGTYELTVDNGCVTKTDEVKVVFNGASVVEIPNIVTYNGDGRNDHFILPEDVVNGALLIFNRWGENVLDAPLYDNSWPGNDLSAGVYFYTLRSDCLPEIKGIIHVMH